MYMDGVSWSHVGEAFPFIVFNPSQVDFGEYTMLVDYAAPHSGKQYLASISN